MSAMENYSFYGQIRVKIVNRFNYFQTFSCRSFYRRLPEKHIPSVYYAFAKLHDGVGEKASGLKAFFNVSASIGSRCYQTMLDILYLPQSGSQPSQILPSQTQYVHFYTLSFLLSNCF